MLGEGDQANALSQLHKAIALDGQRPLPHYLMARIYVQRQDWNSASAELSTLKKLDPNSATLHLQLADYYTQRGGYDLAEGEYSVAVEFSELSLWLLVTLMPRLLFRASTRMCAAKAVRRVCPPPRNCLPATPTMRPHWTQ